MWMYFVEQVWCYDPDEWSRLGWTTREAQHLYWDIFHLHVHPDGTPAYKTLTTYPTDSMVEGNDYIEF